MANQTSQHILGTAVNLLGFCLFVITSFHVTDRAATSIIDEFTSIIALMLTVSCLFSFISIKKGETKRAVRLEWIADYLFLASLVGIIVIILLMVFNVIK